MNFHYYSKLGLSDESLAARLALLDLTDDDHALVERLHQILTPHIPKIIDEFYERLFLNEEAEAIIQRGFDREKLRQTFVAYLCELGVGFDTPKYFESRLRIGIVHIWAGVSLSLYQCSYRILQDALIRIMPRGDTQRDELVSLILKLTNLDISLAVEAYYLAQKSSLEEQLNDARSRVSSLREQQQVDTLTQVHSRDSVLSALKLLLERAANEGVCFCVIMADIDHFKKINDRYGHLVGDKVLKGVAQRLKGSLRSHDFVGRFGGEEFLLVLSNTGLESARTVAMRVLQDISASPVHADKENIDVTISLGMTQVKANDDHESIISRADKALYAAKQNGRNRLETEI